MVKSTQTREAHVLLIMRDTGRAHGLVWMSVQNSNFCEILFLVFYYKLFLVDINLYYLINNILIFIYFILKNIINFKKIKKNFC